MCSVCLCVMFAVGVLLRVWCVYVVWLCTCVGGVHVLYVQCVCACVCVCMCVSVRRCSGNSAPVYVSECAVHKYV